MPYWKIELLQRSLGPLQSEEAQAMATAVRVAGSWKAEPFRRSMRRWAKAAEPHVERPALVVPASEQALAWFEANGIPTA